SRLLAYVQAHPKSVDAHMLLVHAYRGTNDQPACISTLEKLCAIHAAAGEHELVWKTYEEFMAAGGKDLPVNVWLDVCRAAEKMQFFEAAEKSPVPHLDWEQSMAAGIKEAKAALPKAAAASAGR